MPCNTNVMGYPFLDSIWAMSSLPLLSLLLFLLHLSTAYSNLFSFKFQPTIQEHEELVWLVGNLKLEVTQYLKDLYDPGGLAYLSNDDNDVSDGDGGEDSKATPIYQPRKRHFW